MRKKLDDYYATDGHSDTLRIVLPKRTYVPRFEQVTQTANELAPTLIEGGVPTEPEIHRKSRRTLWVRVGFVLLGVVIGSVLTVAILGRQISGSRVVDPALLEAWRPFAKPGANVLLSSATPLTLYPSRVVTLSRTKVSSHAFRCASAS